MNGESLERLMEVILQMRINLAHITETLHQQTYEMREQLGAVFEEEKHALEKCLDGVDDKLKECSAYVDEYRRLHASLSTMRQKLVQLGAEPSTLPPPMPANNVEGIIAWRLRELKEQGKF
jgi:ABC-type enterochelin transport system substrate-binding protein